MRFPGQQNASYTILPGARKPYDQPMHEHMGAQPAIDWPPPAVAVPTAQLLHTLPDGSFHVDWLIARDAAAARSLISFRLPRPMQEFKVGKEVSMEHIGDHRPLYLGFEGTVPGGRGQVRRLNRGLLRVTTTHVHTIEVVTRWPMATDQSLAAAWELSAQLTCRGSADGGRHWHLLPIACTMAEATTFEPPSELR